jgi:signal transduction histidine kinase
MEHSLTPRNDSPGKAVPAEACDLHSVSSGLRLRVLLPLTVAMILLVVIFVSVFNLESRQRQAEDLARTSESVSLLYREKSAEGIQILQSIMQLVLNDAQLEAALRARDRQALFALSAPILKEIRARNRITHFYYILPDRTMLLRVASPGKHGDRIDRYVLQEAIRTGKPSWGNEQGPLGTFTLRVVYPWESKGEVIGYLEMGIEFEDIMQSIKNFLDVNIFVAINKSYFDRAKWEESQAKTPQPVAWDEFPVVVVLSRTAAIPAPIVAYLGALKEQHSKRAFEIAWDGQVAQTVVVPFANLRGQQLGELVVVRDITDGAIGRRQAIFGVAILSVLIGGCLMLLFYVLLGRVQRDAALRTARLGEARRVLSIEQIERQRAEHALGVEQERNELLEARGRIIGQLAAAKEAAEAALQENEKITHELRATQSELLATARRAGMAEIATNVLHNVGNVLNSVNVSADLVVNQVRTSKLAGLGMAVQMINEHAADLGNFLSADAKGKLLPDYLNKLSGVLAAEQRSMIGELTQLTKSISHIKEIVATQQTYAGNSSIREPVQVRDLVEDALRMNDGALARHQVTVVKEFSEVPVVLLNKARVIQILVNLISNAAQAMGAVAGRPHRMTLRVDAPAPDRLRIGVLDQGEGIPAENLTRIFAHGFTTREQGHGFGLHSCALAATEMGGTLTAYSEGPGTGALFTLELPIDLAEENQ